MDVYHILLGTYLHMVSGNPGPFYTTQERVPRSRGQIRNRSTEDEVSGRVSRWDPDRERRLVSGSLWVRVRRKRQRSIDTYFDKGDSLVSFGTSVPGEIHRTCKNRPKPRVSNPRDVDVKLISTSTEFIVVGETGSEDPTNTIDSTYVFP